MRGQPGDLPTGLQVDFPSVRLAERPFMQLIYTCRRTHIGGS